MLRQYIKIYNCVIIVLLISLVFSCTNTYIDKPRNTFMPDMYESRALETYAPLGYLHDQGITFDGNPVKGTIKRDVPLPYELPNTIEGYEGSAEISNPLPPLTDEQLVEAERQYLIHCGICHGKNLDGNGPLYKSGEGPYPAKPATFVGDSLYEAMPSGTMFHSITYGKNLMGSYASQLSTHQRWMIVHYIKYKQSHK